MEFGEAAVLGAVIGFGGLAAVLATLLFGEAVLASVFPRLKPPQRQRIVSVALLVGGLTVAGGLALSVKSESLPPCPEDAWVGGVCVR